MWRHLKTEKLWLPALSVLVALFTLEVAARTFGLADGLDPEFSFLIRDLDGDVDEVYNDEDAWLMWRPRPGTHDGLYAISPAGLRDRDYADPRPAGTLRVVALGDSSTFGHGVPLEQTWHSVLEHRWTRGPIEVLNYGVTGYTSAQGLERFRREAAARSPDLVVAWFGVNDVQARFHLSDRQVMARGGDDMLQRWARGLNRFHAWRLIRGLVHRSARALEGDMPAVPRVSPTEFRENLEALDDAANGAGARLLLISPPVCAARTRGWPLLPALQGLRRVLRLVAEERGIPLIELPEMTEAAAPAHPEWFLDSVHPSAEGHARLARAVLTAVENLEGLSPR